MGLLAPYQIICTPPASTGSALAGGVLTTDSFPPTPVAGVDLYLIKGKLYQYKQGGYFAVVD